MIYKCVLCNRLTVPYAYLSGHPVGPKCAKKAGIVLPTSKRMKIIKPPKQNDSDTLDLFDDQEKNNDSHA